jgi:ATP-dependent RNA helicase MSS116
VPQQTKEQAYIGNLGFIKSLMKRYNLGATGVVELANRFAGAFGCDDIPALSPQMVGKMGLKGVPGLVVEGRGTISGTPRVPNGNGRGGRGGRHVGRAPASTRYGGNAESGGAGFGGNAGFGGGDARFGGEGGKPSRGGGRGGRGGGGRGGARSHEDGNKGEEPSRKRARR